VAERRRRAALAFALPIRLADQVLGAMEFFHRERRLPENGCSDGRDDRNQIGHFMRRVQPSIELREGEARFRSSRPCPPTGYWEQDEQFRLIFDVEPFRLSVPASIRRLNRPSRGSSRR